MKVGIPQRPFGGPLATLSVILNDPMCDFCNADRLGILSTHRPTINADTPPTQTKQNNIYNLDSAARLLARKLERKLRTQHKCETTMCTRRQNADPEHNFGMQLKLSLDKLMGG